MICENMLMGEGFYMSKILARKFVILYKLCQDRLSAAPHYDWKLRAIKTTLYVAGGMKRDQPDLSEDKVLPRRCVISTSASSPPTITASSWVCSTISSPRCWTQKPASAT